MSSKAIYQIAVPGPFLTPLDYAFEKREGEKAPVIGGRVWVPFRNKKVVGVVVGAEATDFDEKKIKPISEVIDDEPLFSTEELALLKWAAKYYHEPLGNVMQTALPKKLRQGEPQQVKGIPAWRWTAEQPPEELVPSRAKTQRNLAQILRDCAPHSVTAEVLNQQINGWRAPMKRLVEQGWVKSLEQSCLQEKMPAEALETLAQSSKNAKIPSPAYPPRPAHALNAEQQAAVDAVMAQPGFQAYLLKGVTGSGKTETYLGMIEQVITQGKQALVLVPEIGLTPQTVARFEAYLQQPVAVMHSALSDSERHCAWHQVKSGRVKVLLGTRSALFTPFADLGLCIMDEEHDLSFKQQDGFRYSARDCLVRRAQLEQVPVVLGSATPSLESLYNIQQGRYQLLTLTQRAANAQMPSLKLLDVRGERINEGVSNALRAAMAKHLEAGNQVLLFLNRRGFAPVLMCDDCGWQANCPNCQHPMTYHHAVQECRCHHCGHQVRAPSHCPSCDSEAFVHIGQGTERLERSVQEMFPEARILRVDRDTTRLKGQMAQVTEQAAKGEADILIGTQMLAKGHHFPKVTMVGVLDIDQGLFSADFRAPERMGQLLVQVSGRAGRGELAGEVWIQSRQPDNPQLKQLIRHGYDVFAEETLRQRKEAELPPYAYQILLRAEAIQPQEAFAFLNFIKQQLNLVKMPELNEEDYVEALGPVTAPMVRRQGRYRYQLLLQSNQRRLLQGWFSAIEPLLYQKPATTLARKVRWSIDVDPLELF
jgi:primosomal protein N' (replication factor Y)